MQRIPSSLGEHRTGNRKVSSSTGDASKGFMVIPDIQLSIDISRKT
jgi:hypothetical protein